MKRSEMHLGQKVIIPAKDIVTYSENEDKNGQFFVKNIRHQKQKILFVRELHNKQCAGLSHTMDTPSSKSYGVLYAVIQPYKK